MAMTDSPSTFDVFWTVRLRWSESVRRDAPSSILDRLDAHYDHFSQADNAARFVAEWAGLPLRRFVITAHADGRPWDERRIEPGSPIVETTRASGRHPARPCRHSLFCRHMT